MAFRPLAPVVARWRSEDGDGLEHLNLGPADGGILAEGVIVGDRGGFPYGVRYRAFLDRRWATRVLDIDTTDGRALRLRSDGAGQWKDGAGKELPHLAGCLDIDLAGSPFTNSLPIRRLALDPDMGSAEFRMVYVPFDNFSPLVDAQRYTCLEADSIFLYEAVDRSFEAEIIVDEDGLVLEYPGLFHRVPL